MPFDPIVPPKYNRRLAAAALIEAGMLRIAHKRNWCRCALYQTRFGRAQYCAIGAVTAVAHPDSFPAKRFDAELYQNPELRLALHAMQQAALRRGFESIVTLNNSRKCKHADVLATMREAVQDLRYPGCRG